MDELVERVATALAAEYPGAPNGRVRDLPDRRAIRWYTTTGLVDRPAAMRGRTALYGPRHLLQIVAVKRRQAEGHTLAAIQAELQGASDAVLGEVARVPESLLDPGPGVPEETSPAPARFWAARPSSGPDIVFPPASLQIVVDEEALHDHRAHRAKSLGALDLGGGVVLVVPGTPGDDDRAEILAAAAPLLALLDERGLRTSPADLAGAAPDRPMKNGSAS
jgi:DNA-binding transcriptional MerR regulator